MFAQKEGNNLLVVPPSGGRELLGCLLLFALTISTATADEWLTLSGPVFGTAYNVKARSNEISENDLQKEIEKSFANIDRRMSSWRSDSDVSRFNVASSTDWIPVDLETAEIVDRAKSISSETDGMFDTTVAPLVALWNFGSQASEDNTDPPTAQQIADVMALVGSEKIDVRLEPPALRKKLEGIKLDLSAIAKGHAVDEVARLLGSSGIRDFMIEIGGEVRVSGTSPKDTPWRIGIESPVRGKRYVDSVVSLNGNALATSGDYRNFREIDGTIYSHTIDPKTGQSVRHDLASISVIADNCETADALATALLAMGHKNGMAWANQHDISAMFLRRSGGKIIRAYTGGFPEVETSPDQPQRSFAGEFFRLASIAGLIFGIAIVAMSIGTILSNRRLTGSCGGIAALTDEQGNTVCQLCSRPSPDCLGPSDEAADSTTEPSSN